MVIESICTRCGSLGIRKHWSQAVTLSAVHVHQEGMVRTVGVISRADWTALHVNYKERIGGNWAVLHRDVDGSTILVPVEVR